MLYSTVLAEFPWKWKEVFPWDPISMRITGKHPRSSGKYRSVKLSICGAVQIRS